MLTIFTTYTPGALYNFTGDKRVLVVPSPKFHNTLDGAGVDVLVNVKRVLTHILEGALKFAFTNEMFTKSFLLKVSEQPELLKAISLIV